MSKLTQATVANILGNPTSAATTINNNAALTIAAVENTLSRDGTTPNQMEADIDLNNNDLLNVGTIDTDKIILGGVEVLPGDPLAEGGYLKNDGSQIAVVKGVNVKPGTGDTLFIRDRASVSGSLSDGIVIDSKSDDFSQSRDLEIRASQVKILTEDGPLVIQGSAGTDLSPQMFNSIAAPASTGEAEGSYLINRFQAEFHRTQVGDGSIEGSEGSGIVNLLHTYIGIGGPDFAADSVASAAFGTVINQPDTSIGDRLGFNSGVLAMFSTNARLYGGSTGVTINEGASAAQMIGFESDMFLNGSTDYKFGFHSWAGGKHQATVVDAAYGVGIRGGTIDGDPVAKWRSVIALFTGTSGNRPVDENTDFLIADETTNLKNVLNLSNITVVEDIIKSGPVSLTGNGQLTLGNPTNTGSVALNTSASGNAFYSVQQNGTPKWSWGVNAAGQYYVYNIVGAKQVISIDPATSQVTIDDDLGVSGTINGAVINENAWTTYTPTVTSQSGTITTVGARTGKYKRLHGRTIVAQVRATVTTAGTAGGGLVFTLPVAAATDIPAIVNGRESALNGKGLSGVTNGTTAFVTYYDATSVFADGVQVTAEVTYEAAA